MSKKPSDPSPEDPFSSDIERKQWQYVCSHLVFDKDKTLPQEKKTYPKKQKQKERTIIQTKTDWEVDLHGCTGEEAYFELEQARELMQRHKLKTLRVIHGGFDGAYGPVRNTLKRLLRTTWRGFVHSSTAEPNNPGSTIVRFRSS